MTSSPSSAAALKQLSIQEFCAALANKQPTPGGGAAAAVGATIGAAAASMSAAYTQRKKDQESGAAQHAQELQQIMDLPSLLKMADDDQEAYEALQSTWKKDCTLTADEISNIQARALRVPTVLLEACHQRIQAIQQFLPRCNPNITSDAKVGLHQLAGAARASYQTVLVNNPPTEEKRKCKALLLEIQQIEMELLQLENQEDDGGN
mmetsp:Transcript_17159/g.39772  ORF Transcript_17159/g.39772 Transcript_17159/m.39772 type:complete len:207 (-) Transcript_17159:147-767(-)